MRVVLVAIMIVSGIASQYAPGVMERVVSVRRAGRTTATLPAGLPPVDGYVAVADCKRIGQIVWLRPEGQEHWERFLVTDCANPADGSDRWMRRNGILVEVDYQTAKRRNTIGRGIHVKLMQRVSERPYTAN